MRKRPLHSIEDLRRDLNETHGLDLLRDDQVKPSTGLATGCFALDEFLASGGFPCGEISLLEAAEGAGACTLWLDCVARITQSGRRAAWVEGDFQLNPISAFQRGVDLRNLFIVGAGDQKSSKNRLWILQELFSSNLFDIIGCDLGGARLPLRESRSLLTQARRSGTALVIFSRHSRATHHEIASVVLSLNDIHSNKHIQVLRAAHRPVPNQIKRRPKHVDFITGPIDSRFLLSRTDEGPSATRLQQPRLSAST
jgi:recombination protein RecA